MRRFTETMSQLIRIYDQQVLSKLSGIDDYEHVHSFAKVFIKAVKLTDERMQLSIESLLKEIFHADVSAVHRISCECVPWQAVAVKNDDECDRRPIEWKMADRNEFVGCWVSACCLL